MKFKVDENLPDAVADFLTARGHHAHTVRDENMKGAEDDSIFAACQREQRVIITMDLDFADVRRYPPGDGAGVIVLRLQRQQQDYVLAFMPRIIQLLESEPLVGTLCIVDEIRTRIRRERTP